VTPLPNRVPSLRAGIRHIGLCSRASPLVGRSRSIPFVALEPLRSVGGVEFHSLHLQGVNSEATRSQRPGSTGFPFHSQTRTSWDDTLSLIARLDAVVTVDTAVAHLAGSLGAPVHVLLHGDADARWGMGETTTPTVRLHRGSIDECIASAAHVLGVGSNFGAVSRPDRPHPHAEVFYTGGEFAGEVGFCAETRFQFARWRHLSYGRGRPFR